MSDEFSGYKRQPEPTPALPEEILKPVPVVHAPNAFLVQARAGAMMYAKAQDPSQLTPPTPRTVEELLPLIGLACAESQRAEDECASLYRHYQAAMTTRDQAANNLEGLRHELWAALTEPRR